MELGIGDRSAKQWYPEHKILCNFLRLVLTIVTKEWVGSEMRRDWPCVDNC